MLRVSVTAALILLSACNSENKTETLANDVAAEAPKAATEVPVLAGEWKVTKIEGGDAAGLGMTASFNREQVSLVTGCIRRAWTYTQDRNIVSFKPNPGGSANCGGGTPSGKAETAYVALEQANIAIFAKEGKEASLSGTGGNLTLERR